jgi:hypothetical protein
MTATTTALPSTVLEYVIETRMGPPNRTGSPGESFWDSCPWCDHEAWHTMPDKPGKKHRAFCYRCGKLADAMDFLALYIKDYGARQKKYREVEAEYQRLLASSPSPSTAGNTTNKDGNGNRDHSLPPRGLSRNYATDISKLNYAMSVAATENELETMVAAYKVLTDRPTRTTIDSRYEEEQILSSALEIARRHEVGLFDFAHFLGTFGDWFIELEQDHMASC